MIEICIIPDISKTLIHEILKEKLRYQKVCARCVSKIITKSLLNCVKTIVKDDETTCKSEKLQFIT